MTKPVINIYHESGVIDNITDSLCYVIHSQQVDFINTSLTFDSQYLIGGEKIIAIVNTTPRGLIPSANFRTVTNVKIVGNRVTWKYLSGRRGGGLSSTIPTITLLKLMGK